MTASRQSRRLRMASALVPLALLSAAWTISIGTTGAPQATAGDPLLPDGSSLPSAPLQVPASVTSDTLPGATGESAYQIVQTSSASSIPAAALAAYQRAETVINRADATCRLPWQLLAAIGRVESNHGRANGNVLGADGIATPGIFGIQLNGAGGTTVINDTDGGQYDGDTQFDRAIGPMQFIPSTWSTVGVDADSDGQRNPQDINDAALGAAVYLCSGDDDLSTTAGQQAAVYRYNHSDSYVATVLAVMRAYLAGDFLAGPNFTIPATYFQPDYTAPEQPAKVKKHKKRPKSQPVTPPPAPATSAPAAPEQPAPPGGDKPTKPSQPTQTPTDPGTTLPVPPINLPDTGVAPVDQVLTLAEATTQCTLDLGLNNVAPALLGLKLDQLLDVLGLTQQWSNCIAGYTNP